MLNDAPMSDALIAASPLANATDGEAQRTARGLLSEERERALLAAYATNGDPDALSELLRAHLRLVLRIARRHRAGSLREEDLVAEGMLGLMEAARRFDPSYGVRFSTYGTHWARAFIQRHALGHRRIVGMPDTRAARRVLGRIGRVEPRLSTELGRAPSDSELACALGVEISDLETVRGSLRARDVALGVPSVDGGTCWEPSDTNDSPEDAFAHEEERRLLHAALGRAMGGLPARERAIVQRRCLSFEPPTLDVLAREMSLSRERVRQLEARAISRLREALAPGGVNACPTAARVFTSPAERRAPAPSRYGRPSPRSIREAHGRCLGDRVSP